MHLLVSHAYLMFAGVGGNETLVYQWGLITGWQLRQVGVSMNMAPVMDVNNNPRNPIIHTRSFGAYPSVVQVSFHPETCRDFRPFLDEYLRIFTNINQQEENQEL